MSPEADPTLLLGPLLRYVDTTRATVWVETDRPCTVEVRVAGAETRTEPTWTVHDHHFALVSLDGLETGSEHEYTVHLDDHQVWPEAGSGFPPSVIRTFSHDESFRLSFGSCRRSAPMDQANLKKVGADALVALAHRMMDGGHERWPDALFLAGDQVYADIPSPEQRARLLAQHGVRGRGPARPGRPDDRGGRGDPELRGVHLALPRHLDGAARPLAAVDRPDRDDPRRPRPARRLEHLAGVA